VGRGQVIKGKTIVSDIKLLAQWPDENLSLDEYIDQLVRPLFISAEQFRNIVEESAHSKAIEMDDLTELLREEASHLAMLLRRRKIFELATRSQGLIS
jgi:hypothetical protein